MNVFRNKRSHKVCSHLRGIYCIRGNPISMYHLHSSVTHIQSGFNNKIVLTSKAPFIMEFIDVEIIDLLFNNRYSKAQ